MITADGVVQQPAHWVRTGLTFLSFPLVFSASIGLGAWALAAGWPAPSVAIITTIAVVIIVAALERVHPYEPRWSRSHGDVRTDLMHGVVSVLITPEVFKLLALGPLFIAADALSQRVGFGVWPTHWSTLAQLPLTIVVSEFPSYWVHRAMHERRALFRLHATHHSAERLYWLNAVRFHPLDTLVTFALQVSIVVLLGAGPDQLVLFSIWAMVHGLFQHGNIDVRLGPLNYVFSMAELHRWHHSRTLTEANRNYGNNCIFWDLVFGTFYWPKHRRPPATIGIAGMPDFPREYLSQLASIWRWKADEWSGQRSPGEDEHRAAAGTAEVTTPRPSRFSRLL